MKGLALEGLHALDAGKLGRGQDAVCQHDEAGPHAVAAIGHHRPALRGLIPGGLLDRRVKQAMVVKAETLRHALAILENLET